MQSTLFAIASAILFSTVAINASSLSQALHARAVLQFLATYEGCYTEATNMRALTGDAYYDNAMTVELCATACADFAWFGVEYRCECYCGDQVNPGSVPTPASDCSFTCSGNGAEKCGAGNRLSMYSKSATAPPPSKLSRHIRLWFVIRRQPMNVH
jgi:hypothetical protein